MATMHYKPPIMIKTFKLGLKRVTLTVTKVVVEAGEVGGEGRGLLCLTNYLWFSFIPRNVIFAEKTPSPPSQAAGVAAGANVNSGGVQKPMTKLGSSLTAEG